MKLMSEQKQKRVNLRRLGKRAEKWRSEEKRRVDRNQVSVVCQKLNEERFSNTLSNAVYKSTMKRTEN